MTKNKILIDLSESDMTKFGKEDFERQSLPQKVFSAIWQVESEVNNGGFLQYFSNGAESALFVVEALETIKAPKTANICDRAIVEAFPHGLPHTAEAIGSEAAELSQGIAEKLESLDTEFLSYPHNLTDLLFAYVKAHPEEFGAVPEPEDD